MSRQDPDEPVSVLFVCMGNICRSPMAQGVFRKRLVELDSPLPVRVDSAGTHSYHVGAPPDQRALAAARKRGIDISDLRARRVSAADFLEFDYILAMDRDNLEQLQAFTAAHECPNLRLYMDFARSAGNREVPDPYYGGHSGFERVLDLVEDAADGLIKEIQRTLNRRR